MKKALIVLGVIIVLGGVAYVGRHKIKALLMGSPTPSPAMQTQDQTTASMAPSESPAMSPSTTAGPLMTKTDPTKGAYLAGANGMSLYVFDKDTKNTSTCYNGCAKAWPAYLQTEAAATLPANVGTTKRTDGTVQYTYNGKPLYYFASDAKVGDVSGDGVGGVWHLAKP